MATSPPIPKAILYYDPLSVWSSAVLLGLEEKGYGSDELEYKVVHSEHGENFSPAYVRINPNGTVPTLVVPLEKTLAPGIDNRYKALVDTKTVLEFLDKSRSVNSRTHTTSSAPAPALAPATVVLSDISKSVITLLHSFPIHFLDLAASSAEELVRKSQSSRIDWIQSRQTALQNYISEGKNTANEAVQRLWKTRLTENEFVLRVYESAARSVLELDAQEKQGRDTFFRKTLEIWAGVKKILNRLEKDMVGPFVLGDQLSLADLHLGAWLTHILYVAGAPNVSSQTTPRAGDTPSTYSGLRILEVTVKSKSEDPDFIVGPKLQGFWDLLTQRDAWNKVYADGLH